MSDAELIDGLLRYERDHAGFWLDGYEWSDESAADMRLRLARVNAEIARRIPQWPYVSDWAGVS